MIFVFLSLACILGKDFQSASLKIWFTYVQWVRFVHIWKTNIKPFAPFKSSKQDSSRTLWFAKLLHCLPLKLNWVSARRNEGGDGGEWITVTLQCAMEEKGNLGAAVLIFAFFSLWLWCFRWLLGLLHPVLGSLFSKFGSIEESKLTLKVHRDQLMGKGFEFSSFSLDEQYAARMG